MVESKIIQKLNKSGIKAYGERPQKPPSQYVIVEKTGSSTLNYVTKHTLAVQSIAPTLAMASKLNDAVKAVLIDAEISGISAIDLLNDYNYTNTTAKEYRYQAVFQVVSLLED